MPTTHKTQHVKRKTQETAPRNLQSPISNLLLASCLFLLALFPRIAALSTFQTVDEPRWVRRSAQFATALLDGDWQGTAVSMTPAVTTLWAGSAGLVARFVVQGNTSVGTLPTFLSGVTFPSIPVEWLPAVRLPIAIATALCVATMYVLARKLFGTRVGLLGAALVALDPFYLAHSRLIHHDALVASFVTISILSAALYLRGHHPVRYAVLSGLAAGLAFLSKATALALVPGLGLMTLVAYLGSDRRWSTAARLAGMGMLWAVAAGLTFVVCWPAMWVAPLDTVRAMLANAVGSGGLTPHKSATFFWGRVTRDPGPWLYPVVFLFRSSPLTLVGLLLALPAVVKRQSPTERESGQRLSAWLLLIFVAFFTVFIAAAAKKADRYLLPVVPVTAVVAAWGWCWLAGEAAARWPRQRWPTIGLGALVGLQAAISLPQYPYYLTYYNPLLGGPQAAPRVFAIGWGEGLDQAGRYLNQKENAAALKVASSSDLQLAPYFDGGTVTAHYVERALWADYTVLYIRDVQADQPSPAMVNYFRLRQPEHVVRLKGIDYAWIYRGPVYRFGAPPAVQHPVDGVFADRIRLIGYDLSAPSVPSGDGLHLTLYWQCLGETDENLNVYLRLTDESGHVWGRADRQPVDGLWPTSLWRAGMIVADEYRLPVRAGAPPGTYRLEAGLYSIAAGSPLPLSGGGATGPGGGLVLGPITVDRATTPPDVAALRIQHAANARLSPHIELLGYDFDGGAAQPGQRVGFTLYWRATATVGDDYRVVVRLLDAEGQVRREWRERPAGGRYPTTGWQRGEVVADWHEITVPANVPSGDYGLWVGLANADDEPPGTGLALGTLTVESRPRTFAVPPIPHPQPANFDNQIALLGYDLEARTRNTQHATRNTQHAIRLTLYWQTLTEMDTSYTVFVHVLDAGGQIVAQRDSVPGQGALPTTGWAQGEVIADQYEIPLPAGTPPGEYRIEVGLYDAASGQRLPVLGKAGQVADNRILLDQTLVVK